jgi:hypothetical protein
MTSSCAIAPMRRALAFSAPWLSADSSRSLGVRALGAWFSPCAVTVLPSEGRGTSSCRSSCMRLLIAFS